MGVKCSHTRLFDITKYNVAIYFSNKLQSNSFNKWFLHIFRNTLSDTRLNYSFYYDINFLLSQNLFLSALPV